MSLASATADSPDSSSATKGDATAPLIVARNLTKNFGHTRALDDVSFEVRRGEIRGFLGPNGAGKSTSIRIVTGYLAADQGEVEVCGHNVASAALEARTRIGYLPESLPLYEEMRVDEYLRFMGHSRGLDKAATNRRIDELLEMLSLGRMAKRPTGTLSKGFRQRVGLAQALIHDPDVLILDEPTNGLDPQQIVEVRSLLVRLAETKAILFSTHILQEIAAICTKIMIIREGKLIADGTPDELSGSLDKGCWDVVISGNEALDGSFLETLKLGKLVTSDVNPDGRVYSFQGEQEKPDLTHIAKQIKEKGRTVLEVKRAVRSLEQLYLRLTGMDGGSK